MTAKKKSSYKHGSYKVFTKNKSFMTSAVALVLVLVGVGSALALSEMSQDTRSNAISYDGWNEVIKRVNDDNHPGRTSEERDIKEWNEFLKVEREEAAEAREMKRVEKDKESRQDQARIVKETATIPNMNITVQTRKKSNGQIKTRLITARSVSDKNYSGGEVVGKIYSSAATGRKALHECYIGPWEDYMLVTSDSDTQPANFCQNKTPGWSETYKGVIGYVGASKTADTAKPLKECFDETNANHYYAVSDPACTAYAAKISPKPATRESWVYGWVN